MSKRKTVVCPLFASFRYKDYGDDEKPKVMQLDHAEFIRRFLLHVLPKGLMRIRHYGYLANCCRARRLPQIWTAITRTEATEAEPDRSINRPGPEVAAWPCPVCQGGRLRVVVELPPRRPGGRWRWPRCTGEEVGKQQARGV